MKPFTLLSLFSTNDLRPVYFAKHATADGTTVLVGIAGKFRSFAEEAARLYAQPLDSHRFDSVRQQALDTFRERFAQQKHQPFVGTDEEILRSFGQLIISPDGTVQSFAWGRFRFSSVQDGIGQAGLPTILRPGQYLIGDAEGVGVTTTVAQNLARRSPADSLDQVAGTLADPFMLVTIDTAARPVYPAPLPVAEPEAVEQTVVQPQPEVMPEPLDQPTINPIPEPSFVPDPVVFTPPPTVVPTPRPPVNSPVQPPAGSAPVVPWKTVALSLLVLILLSGIGGGAYYWRQTHRHVAMSHTHDLVPDTTARIDENRPDDDDSPLSDEEQAALDSARTTEETPPETDGSNEASTLSQAEQLLQQYRKQPDSLLYLVRAAEQVENVSDPDRQQALRTEIDRERMYRYNEQSQVGRTAYDRAILYLMADQKPKAASALQTAQRAYELALLLQPDRADAVRPSLDAVQAKLATLNE